MMIGNMCHPVSTPSVKPGRVKVAVAGEVTAGELEVPLPTGEVVGEFVELDQTERSGEFRWLEVPTELIEDEEVVVLEVAIDRAEESITRALA